MQERNAPTAAGKVLLIEDDADVSGYLTDNLTREGWQVACTGDGSNGLSIATRESFDVMVVDRLMPGLDGISVVRALRMQGIDTPVLFLSALGSISDRVAGLEGGGDDYLIKPFSFAELNARVNTLARRRRNIGAATKLSVGDLVLDRLTRRVTWGEVEIALLPLEYQLLEFLMLSAGKVVTRKMLLEKVWGFQFDPRTNIVETHISHLRRKLHRCDVGGIISTVRGAGYLIDQPTSQAG